MGISQNIPSKVAPVRPHSHHGPLFASPGTLTPPTSAPTLQPQVSTTQVGTHTTRSSATHKKCASTANAGTTLPLVQIHVLVVVHSRSLGLLSCLWYDSDYPNHLGIATSTLQTVTCIINIVSLFHSGIQVQHARTPPRFLQRLVGVFTQLPCKKPMITCSTSRTNSSRTEENTDLAMLFYKGTFEPNPAVYAFQEASSSKDTWGVVAGL